MLGLPLAFAFPVLLATLAALPILYYLLRLTPPPPQRIPLPTVPLIRDLEPEDQRPARTPWWLLLLRMLIAALIIVAMAGPIWNPETAGSANARGPLAIVIDNGWSAASDWKTRVEFVSRTLEAAADRPVFVRGTAESAATISPGSPQAALERLRSLAPQSFTPDRRAQFATLQAFLTQNADGHILWVTDGMASGSDDAALADFARLLGAGARDRLTVIATAEVKALAIAGTNNAADALNVRVLRAASQPAEAVKSAGILRAYDLKGRALGDAAFRFDANATEAEARVELPLELRNEVARVEILNENSAGAAALLDENNSRRRVGIVSGESADTAQPLVSPAFFIRRALEPFADIREPSRGAADPVARLIEDGATMIVLADVGALSGSTYEQLTKFVEEGGVLVRFAGLKLAANSDDLIPVKLRRGGRVLGGTLSWDQPRKLGKFPEAGPFAGLTVPDDIEVQRQVLAEPTAELASRTWAQLDDGTPLVTGATFGKGTVALFHVTADTTWSNLPLSGLFVDLLRRLVATANAGAETGDVAPADAVNAKTLAAANRVLDGFGRFRSPPATARPVARGRNLIATEDHPAGFYGPNEALLAVNVLGPKDKLLPLKLDIADATVRPLETHPPLDLRPHALVAALALFLIDALAVALMGGMIAGIAGRFRSRAGLGAAALLLALALPLAPDAARAADQLPNFRPEDIESALVTRLAYVLTGDRETDETSRLGLANLTRALTIRTALEPGDPIGVDLTRDELVFYPILFWPVSADRPVPPPAAIDRINAYMKQGGTVVFDTRDALSERPGTTYVTPETRRLRQILAAIDVPDLEPIPRDHVVTKSFYLIDHFVGRYTTGNTWIEVLPRDNGPNRQENRPARAGDRVSPIVITSNDLAGAWAMNEDGQPRYPLVPGEGRQREFALRAGVNLVMYALTGNYKSDQVHVDDLLQRLGQ
ncbi:MAG: DUF4159 domain-containing protein [Beijerinckiaceae bacterium]|nr:DUF4159 domain-containing protein [Beijerinckiaceae bacterium]